MPLPQTVHRILVLDDDEIMRDLLNVLLSLEGYTVAFAHSGENALEKLRESEAYDLVLTDLHMPGLEGEELARALRDALPSPTLLIAMSGSQPSAELRSLFDAFILKPFDVQLLRDAMDVAQGNKDALHSLANAAASPSLSNAAPLVPALDEKIFGSLASMIAGTKLSELFAMALIDIEKRHERIVSAVAVNDLETVHREAHAIKGSCGMIGALELHQLAAAIEEGTTLNTVALAEIPRACLRLQSMLKSKIHTV